MHQQQTEVSSGTAAPVDLSDVVVELIRLREVDAQARTQMESALRQDIDALWLRIGDLRRRTRWLPMIFG